MLAGEAKKIILEKISYLYDLDIRWKNCNQCNKNGKCCDGAPISLFPDEWNDLKKYLLNNGEILKYSIRRYNENKICYFYNPKANRCLIYDYRPLNCIWTPFLLFNNGKLGGFIKDIDCNFIKIDENRNYRIIDGENGVIELDISDNEKNKGYLQYYILLQSIREIFSLLNRNDELEPIEYYYHDFVKEYQ